MRAPHAAIVFAVIALLGVPSTALASPEIRFGTEQNGAMDIPQRRELVQTTQQALGSKVVRFLLRWDHIAKCDPRTVGSPTDPNNRCYDFSVPDAVLKGADQRGMSMLYSVYGTPKWVFGAGENWTGGSDAEFAAFSAQYADFVQAAATRYDGRHGLPHVPQWTIWNEPNGSFFQPRAISGTLVGPQRYARMYDAAARRIKAIDSNMRVAVGPTAPHAASLPPIKFAEAALPVLQQLGSPIDAWAHNAYMGAQSPYSTTIDSPYVGLGNLDDLHAVMDRYSVARGKTTWVTEFGYQTSGAQKAVSVEQQAVLGAEAMRYAYYAPRLDTFIWYSVHDDEETGDVYSFQSGLFYPASKLCGEWLCAKPMAGMFLHTLWVGPNLNGLTTIWGQGRMQPGATKLYVQRPGDGWRAYSNTDTATTGTVNLRMRLPVGTKVMTCDVRCGAAREVGAKTTTGGGGTAAPRIQKLGSVTLGKRASLRSGIVYGVNCTGCRVTARILARGPLSGIASARRRTVIIGSGRVRASGNAMRVHMIFTRAAKRELTRRRTAVVTLRTYITYGNGSKVITDRPVRLR